MKALQPAAAEAEGQGLRAMVLAAGLGTRLRPLTSTLAKPLVPFLGKALLDHNLDALAEAGAVSVAVNAYWRAESIVEHLARRAPHQLQTSVWVESELLGTGGALGRLGQWLLGAGEGGAADTRTASQTLFLAVNGDVVFPRHALRLLLHAHQLHPADATLLLTPPALTAPEARKVAIRADGTIAGIDGVKQISERALPVGLPNSKTVTEPIFEGYGYGCALVGGETLLHQLPSDRPGCLKEDGFWPLLRSGGCLRGFVLQDEFWRDLGTPDDYLRAHIDALLGKAGPLAEWLPWDLAPAARGVWLDRTAQVHASARLVPPVALGPMTIVESGAIVGPCAVLDTGASAAPESVVASSVLWPGARAYGHVFEQILRPSC